MISVKVNEVFQYLTATDEELLKKCHQCMEIIVSAKDRQAAEANRHASILLEQLDREKSLEENKKAAAARKREKRRRKKKEKAEQAHKESPPPKQKEDGNKSGNNKNSSSDASSREKQDDDDDESIEDDGKEPEPIPKPPSATTSTTTGLPSVSEANAKNQAHKRSRNTEISSNSSSSSESNGKTKSKKSKKAERERDRQLEREAENEKRRQQEQEDEEDEETSWVPEMRVPATPSNMNVTPNNFQHSNSVLPSSHSSRKKRQESAISTERHGIGELDDFTVPAGSISKSTSKEKERNKKNTERSSKVNTLRESFALLSPGKGSGPKGSNAPSPKKNQKKEEGWKEVTRKTCSTRSKKVTVPSNAISRVIGRGGSNINAIREVSGAHIDVDKQKGSGDRIVVIKGSAEATRQAHNLISSLIKDPDKDLDHLIPKHQQRNSSVYQNNNNNSATPSANTNASTLPISSAPSPAVLAGVTTCAAVPLSIQMTQIFSTSVWHNNMASHLSSTASPMPSSLTSSQAKAMASATTKAASIATSLAITTSQLTAPFANVVRQSHSANSHRLAPSGAPMGAFQTGPVPSSASPKRPSTADASSTAIVSSGSSPSKSPSAVSRRLFQSEKCANATTAKTSVTYSTVSMAKTKVTTATSQTFASKVDCSMISNGSNMKDVMVSRHNINIKSQTKKTSTAGSPTPASVKLQQQGLAISKQPADPQPLPIKTSLSNTRLVSSQARAASLVSVPPSDYSPFNSRFSQLDMLGKKEDSMNFASVAAAGVITTTASVIGSVSPAPLDSHADPNLPAKAPGYKAPNQRTSSPHILDPTMGGGDVGQRQVTSSPGGPPLAAIDVAVLESQMKALAHSTQVVTGGFPHHHPHPHHHHHHHHLSNHQTMQLHNEADPSKAPGYKGGFIGDHSEHHRSAIGGFRNHIQSGLSPRPSHFSVNSGPFSLLSQHPSRDEYSTPDQPMTLPKIESTLNPNAPDFTSRSYEPSGRFSHMSGLNMGPGFVPGFGSIGGLAGMGPPPSMGPGPVGMHTGSGSGGGGFRVQPPSGGVLNQQNVTPMMNSAELLSQGNDIANANNQVLAHMANAGYMGSGAMTVPSSMVRQFKNMPPSGPSSSTTPPIGASSKGESPIPADPSPASSSAPSPTDHPGLVSDTMPRALRPIGTERAHKKPQPSGFSIPEAGAAGLWSFNSDLGPEWMSAMTSVMTSGVVTTGAITSGVMTPGLSAEGENHVGPPSMPPPVLQTPYPTDSHMDPNVELPFGPSGVVFAANGVPAGAAAALPLSHVYTQAPMAVDRLPSMWGQSLKGHPDPTLAPQDPKLVRPHFSH